MRYYKDIHSSKSIGRPQVRVENNEEDQLCKGNESGAINVIYYVKTKCPMPNQYFSFFNNEKVIKIGSQYSR